MSEILDKLGSIAENIELLNKRIDSTNLENDLLKNQQSKLVSEKSELLKKNEVAKMELKALLDRIDNIKDHGKDKGRYKYSWARYFCNVLRPGKRYITQIERSDN